jgi:hypothetical protein
MLKGWKILARLRAYVISLSVRLSLRLSYRLSRCIYLNTYKLK